MEIQIKIDNKILKAEAQIIKGQLWLHYQGRTFVTEMGSSGKTRAKSAQSGPSTEIHAPMPGKVTKILVTQDSQVEKGQAVLVMEAMKMEYTLKAEVNGFIGKINCQSGEQVSLGQLLVQLKEES